MYTCLKMCLTENFAILLITICLGTTMADSPTNNKSNNTQVDIIIKGLNHQIWSEEDKPCLGDTLLLLNNVKNYTLWAVWIWNSIQHPTGQFYGSRHNLGSYDQCLEAPSLTAEPKFLTQYCLVNVKLNGVNAIGKKKNLDLLASTIKFFSSRNDVGRDLGLATWGVCLPAVCKPISVSKIVKAVYSVNPLSPADPEVLVDYCQRGGEKTQYDTGFYVFIAVLASLFGTAVISTYCMDTTSPNAVSSIARAFCMNRNASALFKPSTNELRSLHFLKAVTVIFITAVHVGLFVAPVVSNGQAFDEFVKIKGYFHNNIFQRSDITISNFLLISSILLMRALLDKKYNPLIIPVARYFRLIGSFALMIFYTISVSIHTGDGPIWTKYAGREMKACQDNWWANLLMLNNYVNADNICQLVSWYVPCDYQLAVMGVLLYCLWQKNRRAAEITAAGLFIFGVLAPGVSTYWNRLPGVIVFHDMEKMLNPRTNDVYINVYMRSHYRIASFLVGMAMGYIMSVYKPEKHRGFIRKDWTIVMITIANIVAVKTVIAADKWCLRDYNPLDSAVYASTNNLIWTVAMCVNIAALEYGDVGNELNSCIQFPGFVYMSRLAYGIHLTHFLIVQRNFYSIRSPVIFDIFALIIESIGVLIMSVFISVLLWVLVDAPLNNLTYLVLKRIYKPEVDKIRNDDENDIDINIYDGTQEIKKKIY